MKIIKLVLSVILTILSLFFVIKVNSGNFGTLLTLFIISITSIPFYILYNTNNKKYRIISLIVSVILFIGISSLLVETVTNTTGIVQFIAIEGLESYDSSYQYNVFKINWEGLFMILYFITLFVNLFACLNQYDKEDNNEKFDILIIITFLLNIFIYCNSYFNNNLPNLDDYSIFYNEISYVSSYYGLFTLIFILNLIYNKINQKNLQNGELK